MTTQPEQILEDSLVAQLAGMGYEKVAVHDEASLLDNLKAQIEAHNKVVLSDSDFRQILNKLSKGSIFEKVKTLRDRVEYVDAEAPIPWVRLYKLPQFTYFPHKWHVRAGLSCETCHSDIGQSMTAVRHQVLDMEWCIECHEQEQVSVDCVLCHK